MWNIHLNFTALKVNLSLYGSGCESGCSLLIGWRVMLTYHVHQGHVHEEPGCEGEYPRGDVLGVVSNQNPGDHAQVGHHGRQHVVKNGLTHRHAGLQEHRKVT